MIARVVVSLPSPALHGIAVKYVLAALNADRVVLR